ncbi:hypothetical protein FRC19_008319 [Serendipita sp. 401]|nr:hypothetical protein FRC19_008319 [Serendipita sp. 401]
MLGNTATLCFDCASLHRTRHSGLINVLFYCLQDCELDDTRSSPDDAMPFETFPDLSPSVSQISELTMTSNVQQRVPQDPMDLKETSSEHCVETEMSRNDERKEKSELSSPHKFSSEALKASIEDIGAFLSVWVLDVTKTTLQWMKTVLQWMKHPIAFGIVLCITFFALSYTASYITSLIAQSLAPLCSLPLITAMFPTCSAISPLSKHHVQVPRFAEFVDLQTKLEPVIQDAGVGRRLALDIRNSQRAVRDLRVSVKLSDLELKDSLVAYMDEFASGAGEASMHLTKLDGKVAATMDAILVMDEHTIKRLEAIERQEMSRSNFMLSIFGSSVTTREELMNTFKRDAGLMKSSLRRLVDNLVVIEAALNKLDSKLGAINDIISTEDIVIMVQKAEVLAEFWTNFFRLNRTKLANFESHRALLSKVAIHNKAATKEIGEMIVYLQGLSGNLDDLMDIVTARTDEEGAKIPIGHHIDTLRKGVERLTESRAIAQQREGAAARRLLDGPQYPELGSR